MLEGRCRDQAESKKHAQGADIRALLRKGRFVAGSAVQLVPTRGERREPRRPTALPYHRSLGQSWTALQPGWQAGRQLLTSLIAAGRRVLE